MTPRTLRLLLIVAIPILLLILSSSYLFEWMWMNELGYSSVFWTIRGAQLAMTIIAFFVASLYLIPNLRYLAERLRYASFTGTPLQNVNLNFSSESGYRAMRFFLTLAALFIAFLFAIGFYISWDESLRFIWNEPYGEVDPIFGKDIGFYLFQLPFWDLIQNALTVLSSLTLAILAIIYLFTGQIASGHLAGGSRETGQKVTEHLKLNGVFWLLMISWGFYLARYNLLLRTDGIVSGLGYTHHMIELPALWILTILTLALAGMLIAGRWIDLKRVVPATAILAVVVMVLGRVVIPGVVQTFSVDPNELEYESPYIEHNIRLTRMAYGLDQIREVEYQAEDTLTINDIRNNQEAIDNIRLWDSRLLIQTYRQLQEIRSYYEFYTVDNDRYMIDGKVVQTMLSAREIAQQLPSQSDTWVNRHLQYTHGYGLVMNSVTETTQQGEPRFLLRDIPPTGRSDDLGVDNPAIYYGENSFGYYIVNTDVPELHYPSGEDNVYTHYSGSGGIQISSFARKLLFAWVLGDVNILLSDYIHDESRLQIHRSVQERIRRVAPFLELDRDPYLILNNGKLYWLQDAYTTSSHFPYSQSHSGINYIRNSVKILVDAYEGSVDMFVADEEDPILNVYRSIFPDLFQPLEALPEGLEYHFRYPQDMFEIQLEIYNRYHMQNPQIFYNQEDLWTRPGETYAGQRMLMQPYYVLARLPGESEMDFMLISPTTPENRSNMIGWLAAKSDPANYGELVAYRLPKDRLIYGPAQIEARIDQDPEISRQLALWDQRGSRVLRGNLMVIPVEDSFVYVEPVFLIAESGDIPQLQRVIVAIGDGIAMQPTIEEAIFELFGEREDYLARSALSPLADDGVGLGAETVIVRESEEIGEIRELWQQIRNAMESGEWERYGELLRDLDELIGTP